MRHTSKRGKRGGMSAERRRDIHSKLDGMPSGTHSNHHHTLKGTSATAMAEKAAGYFQCATIEETAEDYVIPRQSITRKQLLGIFPQVIETAPIPTRQLDKRAYDGKATTVEAAMQSGMIETTENRLTWKSDRTLLRRETPLADPEARRGRGYKREGSVSVGLNTRKYRKRVPSADPVMEEIIGPAIDDEEGLIFQDPNATITDEDIAAAFDTDE